MSMMLMNSDDIARASARLTENLASQKGSMIDATRDDDSEDETFGVAALDAQKKEEEAKKKFMQTVWTQGGRD